VDGVGGGGPARDVPRGGEIAETEHAVGSLASPGVDLRQDTSFRVSTSSRPERDSDGSVPDFR
jgi:hypothetical protein